MNITLDEALDQHPNPLTNALCECLKELGLDVYIIGNILRVIRTPQRFVDIFKTGVIITIEGEYAHIRQHPGAFNTRPFHLGDPNSIDDIYIYCLKLLYDLDYDLEISHGS